MNVKIEVNFTDNNYSKGQVVKVRCDDKGVPLSNFWRRRFKDAENDNCVRILKNTKVEKGKEK